MFPSPSPFRRRWRLPNLAVLATVSLAALQTALAEAPPAPPPTPEVVESVAPAPVETAAQAAVTTLDATVQALQEETMNRATQRRPFGPAERLLFDCSYLGIPVGKLEMSVAAETPLNGEATWPIIGTATTNALFMLYPVKDRYISWWNPERSLSVGNELLANENRVQRRERVRFDRSTNRAVTRREGVGKPRTEKAYEVPEGAQDLLASLYALRLKPLSVGDAFETPIFTGSRSFNAKVTVVGKERIDTQLGAFDAKLLHIEVAFEGSMASKRAVRLFVSDDEHHLPLRADAEFLIGTLAADLVSHEKGLSD